jgi:hypothetical protein
MPKFSSPAKLAEAIAAGVAKRQPAIDAAVKAAVNAHDSTSRAIAKLNNPRTTTAKADGQAAEAARAMLTGARHVPSKDEIQRAIGSPVPLKNLTDHDQVKAIMIASRGKRS